MATLVHELILRSAALTPHAPALRYHDQQLDYASLATDVEAVASGLLAQGLQCAERVAIFLEKRLEAVTALFGVATAGGTFVPVNPVLKPEQVMHIVEDCGAGMLITSAERLHQIVPALRDRGTLHTIVVIDATKYWPKLGSLRVVHWSTMLAEAASFCGHRRIDNDMAAIFYTSGSTGRAKGVVVSHRNLVAGAQSVCSYLGNNADDRLLCLLPLSFDYGLNQLLTVFSTGATAVLMNHLLVREIPTSINTHSITGLAAVPPLWIQLADLAWPPVPSLRYITNSGGALPRPALDALRSKLPSTKIYLMYGLTEAFRSTYLPPDQLDRRPGSIGKAIPNAEVLVLREDGTPCAPNEPGELVHRGALVSLGYWNDPARTNERFRAIPTLPSGLPLAELAVWSGDTVRQDEDGFLYFIGRRDEMIKTSGYRVSPTEIEEVLYSLDGVLEAVAFGVAHPVLGQSIVAVVVIKNGSPAQGEPLMKICKQRLPAFMCPSRISVQTERLPRNGNGKLDRQQITLDNQQASCERRL